MTQPRCATCQRTTATHAPGCSRMDCPHRKAEAWCGTEGSQGFPGLLAEDRILMRRNEKDRCVELDIADL